MNLNYPNDPAFLACETALNLLRAVSPLTGSEDFYKVFAAKEVLASAIRKSQKNPTLEITSGTPIAELNITTRTENCLMNEKIEFIEQLIEYSPRSLTRIQNLGAKSIREIQEQLALRNLKLKNQT
jgi:DNA-directed RNA polymerase alpha subunit